MLTLTFPIARTTFVECIRQPIYFLMIIIATGLLVLTTAAAGFSMGYTESGEVSGDNKLLLDLGLATVFAVSVLLAGFVATSAISREIENKTVLTVVSKPVPRAVLIAGKWMGVTGAMLVATSTMLIVLLMAIRHGVLTAVSDPIDQPILIFGVVAILLSTGLGVWGSYFYGWSFPGVTAMAMLPLLLLAYVMALTQKKGWGWQESIWVTFTPQVFLACVALLICVPVLTAIAVAFSSRLGQVMTIVVCFGIFVLGLLSTSVLGSRALTNEPIGEVLIAEADRERMSTMRQPGDVWYITSKSGYRVTPKPGDAFYFATSPNGVDMAAKFQPLVTLAPDGSATRTLPPRERLIGPGIAPGQIITAVEDRKLTVMTIGGDELQIERTPRQGDYIFLTPSKVNLAATAAWGILPNVQFFWLIDAVGQNSPIPLSYLGMLALYACCHVVFFLGLAVVLFEKRDVG